MLRAYFVTGCLIAFLCVSMLPSFYPVSSTAASAQRIPVWAFSGAFANYTLTESTLNFTVDSGWQTFTVNEVNLTDGTFLMTVELFDQAKVAVNGGFFTNSGIFLLNQSLAFPALNSTDLAKLNKGMLPPNSANSSVATETLVSVRAGTFQADTVTYSAGTGLIWIDSFSGVVLKSGITISRASGPNGTVSSAIVSELTSTNVPMSETLPFNIAWLVVSVVAVVFLVIGLLMVVVRRSGIRPTQLD